MDSKTGGYIFIGTTLAMAALDGALIGLVVAGGVGYFAFGQICKLMDKPVNAIYAKLQRDLQDQVNNISDKELRAKQEKKTKQDLATLAEMRAQDDCGRQEAAKWMAIGAFAFPIGFVAARAAVAVLDRPRPALSRAKAEGAHA
jgi:hypothetical protein